MAKKAVVRRSGRTQERIVRPSPGDVVSFSVLCAPWTGATLEEFRSRLSLRTVREFMPDETIRRRVTNQLRDRGFEVFESPGPVVTARGTVERFTRVFDRTLVKRIRKIRTPGERRVETEASLELAETTPIVNPAAVPDALLVIVAQKPTYAAPRLPPVFPGRNLHLPGDIAQVMMASATHRRSLPSGDRATGGGVTVAVVDSGFATHPYFTDHDYRITRIAAPDTSDPSADAAKHGTAMLAALFACAPDVEALAVKAGDNPTAALNAAIAHGGFRVCSLSWGRDLEGETKLPTTPLNLLDVEFTLLSMMASGVVVVAAAGNNGQINFPAMMPDVIAVGGATLNADDVPRAYDGGSSFRSTIFKGRDVPDVCALASEMLMPFRLPAHAPDWMARRGATSMATAQVAGIVALLLQKNATLSPHAVRDLLMCTARDIEGGTTATGDQAQKGQDLATGAGLVCALSAWNKVP